MREYFKKLMLEFTLDKDGNPVYPSNNDSVADIVKKHGYEPHPSYRGKLKFYYDDKGNKIDHDVGNNTWRHFSKESNVYNDPIAIGDKPEQLDKYLTDYHK